jgi:hypothetical protein
MDLIAYAGVIRRQWRIVVIGLAIAQTLAFLAVVRVTSDGLEHRSPTIYAARSTLLVTEKGFPLGRSTLTETETDAEGMPVEVERFAEQGRMEYLASIYTELARSRAVRRAIDPGERLPAGAYEVIQLKGLDGATLPLLAVVGTSRSPELAISLSNRAAEGLRRYVHLRQVRNKIPPTKRVGLPTVARAEEAEVMQGVKLTRPILIILLGSIVTLVVAFTWDNATRFRRGQVADTKVARIDPAHHVAAVEEPVAPGRDWDQPKTADHSST